MADYDGNVVRPSIPRPRPSLWKALIGLALTGVAVIVATLWGIVRVEVAADEVLVLVNKTGKTLPAELADRFSDQVILYPELVSAVANATGESEDSVREGYKGIRLDVLAPVEPDATSGMSMPVSSMSTEIAMWGDLSFCEKSSSRLCGYFA